MATPAPQAAPGAPALSPADIERVLAMLRDDTRRAEFTATLEALLRAGGAAPEPPAESLIALPPSSLGAQVLVGLSDRVETLSQQVVAAAQAFNNLPGLLSWFERVWASPWLREKALDAFLMVLLLVGAGWSGHWLITRLLAPFRNRLNQAQGLALPYRILRSLLRFVLDLLPIAAFMATTYAVVLSLQPQLTTRLILLSVNNALILVALVMCVARTILSPTSSSLRPIPLSHETAAYLFIWLRRIVAVAVFGFVAGEAGMVLGMDPFTHAFLQKIVWLVVSVFLVMIIAQSRRGVAGAIRAREESRGIWALTRNRVADLWHIVAILYVIAAWAVLALEIPDGFERMLTVSVASLLIVGIAKGIENALGRTMDRAFAVSHDYAAGNPGLEARVNRYLPILRGLAVGILWLGAGLLLFQAWGLNPTYWFKGGALGARLVAAGISIGFTILVALVIWELVNAAIERHLAKLAKNAQTAKSARARTLMPMLRTTLMVVIFVFVVLTVLAEIGVNVAPLLAGAGVIGIAVGFGSQKLVQDVITGAFLLFEDSIAVGDVVSLGGLSGVVEQLTIRSIRLRALDGSIHIVPFSAVTTVTNMTRDYGYAVFDLSIGYSADSDRVQQVLREIGKEMREEDRWAAVIREPLEVMGIERLGDTTMMVRARFKTDPGSRWNVNREFLRRVKYRFELEGIPMSVPQQTLLIQGGAHADAPAAAPAAAG